ncbi:alpha/beta hydrolase family protein [Falsiroseomonas oryziterrae]|uniref:alpha/beta hydrolase family protein n=1 Tax=Falsiroseomonas oryziterrae TaxID=2911368 RepID=UPI001F47F42D|nr:acetylhydrolase [Roseomonas sp. NPKOSM-4]
MTRRSLLAGIGAAALPAEALPASPPLRDTWRDAARGRDLPVLLRLPAASGPRPLVILSHGLGGSREGLGYLGRALAEAGFVALHLQHPGSDEAVWRGAGERGLALAAAALDVAQAAARLGDGVFAVEEVLRRNSLRGDPLGGRVDPARLAVAGHSYGAWTVQHLLGQRIPGGERGLPVPERRLCAGIALSPVPPRGLPPRLAFARIEAPILHMTGTEDRTFVDGTQPEDREVPFRATESAPAALVVLAGATHAAFADEQAAGPRWSDPTYHPRIAALSLLFLRAMLDGEAPARAALRAGAPGVVTPADRVETKGI